jgi:choline-sulfatase
MFIDRLRSRESWRDTIVSITADHGESLGEHGEKTHGFFVYDSTLLVPWVARIPGHKATRVSQQARLIDVLPTLLEFARGHLPPAGDAIDGVSLSEIVQTGKLLDLEAYSETYLPRHQFGWSELRSLRTERTKFIAAPVSEVYDLRADPGETRNQSSLRPELVASLSRQLAALEQGNAAEPVLNASDPALAEQFMALGYIAPSVARARHDDGPRADPKDKVRVYQLTMDALESSEAGRAEEALALLDAAERLDRHVAQVPFLRGVILGNVGRFGDAARALERAVVLSPHHAVARFKLALAYLRTGRSRKAETVLYGVLQDEPRNVRALHNLAAIAYSRADLDRAAALEQQALAIDPGYAEAWNTLGAIDLLRKQPARAATALGRATTLDPRNAQAFRNLAMALRATGDTAGANRAAARACELDPRLCVKP